MLDSLSLKNFKAFENLSELKVAPVTVLCGTNSSGKSTLLQSILMWKQSLESQNLDQVLLLNGRLIHLGSFSNIVHGKEFGTSVSMAFRYCFGARELSGSQRNRRSLPAAFFLRDLVPRVEDQRSRSARPSEDRFRIEYSVTLKAKEPQAWTSAGATPVVVEAVELAAFKEGSNGEVVPGARIQLEASAAGRYNVKWWNVRPRSSREEFPVDGEAKSIGVEFANLVPQFPQIRSSEDQRIALPVFAMFGRVAEILRAIHGSFSYIGPLRDEPARRYIYEDEVVEIGVKGENAPYLFLSEGDNMLDRMWFRDYATEEFTCVERLTLGSAMIRWMKEMGVSGFGAETTNEIIRLLVLSREGEKARVNIADVGFGVSQIFPILLEGLRMPAGHTLILEQPEIHLHPELQMKLADYIVSLALSGRRAIVETHSDHFVNRLVRRIIEDESSSLQDLIRMYFVKRAPLGSTGSVVEGVDVDPRHGITNWPAGFFDQQAAEQESIVRAGLKKRAQGSSET